MWVSLGLLVLSFGYLQKGSLAKGRGGVRGPVKRVYFFARLVLSVGVLVAVAVSRRLTSFSVMAPLPARATRAFSNNWLLSRM